jgi:hypothetical protein
MANNPVAISDVDNEVLRESDEYLRKHKILELFEVSRHFIQVSFYLYNRILPLS